MTDWNLVPVEPTFTVRKVPAGFAVGTQLPKADGDLLGFYLIGPDENGHYTLEDDEVFEAPDLTELRALVEKWRESADQQERFGVTEIGQAAIHQQREDADELEAAIDRIDHI